MSDDMPATIWARSTDNYPNTEIGDWFARCILDHEKYANVEKLIEELELAKIAPNVIPPSGMRLLREQNNAIDAHNAAIDEVIKKLNSL